MNPGLIRRKALVCAVLVSIPLSTLGIVMVRIRQVHQFSSDGWKRASVKNIGSSPDNPRAQMVESLKKEHLTIGASREALLLLLGPPDEASTATDQMISYHIGGNSGGWLIRGGDFLILEFDGAGRLLHFTIHASG